MPQISPEALEGRLMAQRKVLAMLVADLPSAGRARAYLEQRAVFQDHEEDPGIVPSEEFAIEAAVAEELRLIAEAVRSYRDGREATES